MDHGDHIKFVPSFGCQLFGIAADEYTRRPAPVMFALVLISELDSKESGHQEQDKAHDHNPDPFVHLLLPSDPSFLPLRAPPTYHARDLIPVPAIRTVNFNSAHSPRARADAISGWLMAYKSTKCKITAVIIREDPARKREKKQRKWEASQESRCRPSWTKT